MEETKREGKEKLTAGRVASFQCEAGKQQSFLWDASMPGLAVRATAKGSKAYIFQSRLNGKVIRLTIGDCRVWVIDDARNKAGAIIKPGARQEAARLQSLIDQGDDPRQVKADRTAEREAKQHAQKEEQQAAEREQQRGMVSLADAWKQYIEARRSKWSARHLFDHEKVIQPAITKGKDGATKTLVGGVLSPLAELPLSELTPGRVGEWLEAETKTRATQAALAFRLLRAFINWSAEHADYKGIASPDACARKVSRERLPKAKAKNDALQREQLKLWFESVGRVSNSTISVYLQGLLITGARRNELAGLRWDDVDLQWNSLTIRDKVEGARTIPLTPYFSRLLLDLKNRNETPPTVRRLKTLKEAGKEWAPSEFVFSSQTSESGRLEEPGVAHRKAIAAAGLPPVSLHGLRRSFGSLAEWCEVPVGVVAQIMGHKPSATAEKHYRERPLDLLRLWHTRIEAWLLDQAGIVIPAAVHKVAEPAPVTLSAVG